MSVVDNVTGTRIDEIAPDIFRINTPFPGMPGGFSFNQYLIRDEAPLLFHTGPRKLFAATVRAVQAAIPIDTLRYVAFSHYEADECGALNDFLAAAPYAMPVCSTVAAMIAINDQAIREPKALAHGETLALGRHTVEWVDAPHLPHGWECGYLFAREAETLFCGDLFTQPGLGETALTTSDILGPSEAFRRSMDYFSHTRDLDPLIARLAGLSPTTLACMHGSAWHGDGARLLRALGQSLARAKPESIQSAEHADSGKRFEALGHKIEVKLDRASTNDIYTVLETIDPPGSSPPRHVHADEDEIFYVLDGRVRFWRGDEVFEAGPGAAVFMPRNVPHTLRNIGEIESRMLVVAAPGRLQGFFEEARHITMPRDADAFAALAARYGITMLGAPESGESLTE